MNRITAVVQNLFNEYKERLEKKEALVKKYADAKPNGAPEKHFTMGMAAGIGLAKLFLHYDLYLASDQVEDILDGLDKTLKILCPRSGLPIR